MKKNNSITRLAVITTGIAALGILPAKGALLVYEGFDYPAGTFSDGASGGSGWTGNWFSINAGSPTETIAVSSLVSPVPHLASTGGQLSVVGSGDRFHRSVSGQAFGTNGTTIYISFLAAQLGTTASNGAIELTRGGGSTQNVLTFGSDTNGTPNFGANDKAGADTDIVVGTVGSALAPDTNTHLWVVKIDYLAGDNDNVQLWYDGVDKGSQVMGNMAFTEFGALFFSGTAGMLIDEIRIGTEFADVAVPEPSVALLGGLGLLGLLRRRR